MLPLLCPAWGGGMRILAFRTDPPVVPAILLHREQAPPRSIAWGEGLPHNPPPLSPARGPPRGDVLAGFLDQTPASASAEPDPVPDFDRSLPDDFDL